VHFVGFFIVLPGDRVSSTNLSSTASTMKSLLLLLVLPVLALSVDTVNPDIVLSNVARTVDLTSQLVKMHHAITVHNGGSSATKTVHFTLEKALADKVVFVGATQGGSAADKTYLRVTETKLSSDKDLPAWKIELKSSLAAGAETKIDVEVILGKVVEMFPKEITQREKQLVLYTGNHYVFSPYKVKTQTTKIQLPSGNVESYTKTLKPVSQSDTHVTYGAYSNVAPFSFVS
jgi:oligosaccharyltransferase complex subunit alpha (ribophorin I)